MKKCFYFVADCCFILSRDQSIPGDCLFFLALGVGRPLAIMTEETTIANDCSQSQTI